MGAPGVLVWNLLEVHSDGTQMALVATSHTDIDATDGGEHKNRVRQQTGGLAEFCRAHGVGDFALLCLTATWPVLKDVLGLSARSRGQ